MRIVKLKVENIKKIKVVEITPKGDVVKLEGKNAQGKSSIMDAIRMALSGEKAIPADPVRHGEDYAEILVDLGDIVVSRVWKKGKKDSALEIKRKDGTKITRPQEFLNDKLKLATFDPSAFMRMSPKERVEELKKIPGLDCTKEDEAYLEQYNKRTLVNRDLETAKRSLSEYTGIVAPKDIRTVPEIQKEIDALEKKNEGIREHNKGIADKQAEWDKLALAFKNLKEKRESLLSLATASQKKIEQLKHDLELEAALLKKYVEEAEDISVEVSDLNNKGQEMKKEIELSMPLQENSTAKLKEELLAASEVSTITAKLARKKELDDKIAGYEAEVKGIEKEMQRVLDGKRSKLKAFSLPVPGLEIGERDMMFSGVAFDSLSTAQQLLISCSLGMAEKPEARIMLMKEGSLFDEKSMELIRSIIKENDFQLWLETVSDEPTGDAIYIEEGEVAGV